MLESKELTHLELMDCIEKRLQGNFEGSIGWYSESIKLDLEARKIIERQIDVKPQTYRLKK
jgi:Asp-tRNA(Asn)/Glu-tRNA(Gln) amidotransferase C subunit